MTKKRLQAVMADVYAQYGQEKTLKLPMTLKILAFTTLPRLVYQWVWVTLNQLRAWMK